MQCFVILRVYFDAPASDENGDKTGNRSGVINC